MENSPSRGSTRAHSTEKRYALRFIAAASSTSSSQRFHESVAGPDGSRNTDGVTFSRNQVSLSTFCPSVWWPELATPQRKSDGKLRVVTTTANARSRRPGSSGPRYLASPFPGSARA